MPSSRASELLGPWVEGLVVQNSGIHYGILRYIKVYYGLLRYIKVDYGILK